MKLAHSVHVRVFSYEDEENLVLEKLLKLFPFGLKEEKIVLKRSNTHGFDDRKIIVFEVLLEKERHVNKFIHNLADRIDGRQKNKILSESDSRLDDNLDFFLRFDKKEYLDNNELVLTDSGNCFHTRICIAAFPKKKETGVEIVKELFKV